MSTDSCKYCENLIEDIDNEGLKCTKCTQSVHLKCLRRGTVPGGLTNDVFFTFTCSECGGGNENFVRAKVSWLQVITLTMFHMQAKNPGLTRRSYFHWKLHLATFIDKNWKILFPTDFKKKKKWIGTISGTLSHNSPHFFYSGTTFFGGEPGWWTLTYPKLTPNVIWSLSNEWMNNKSKFKTMGLTSDLDIIKSLLKERNYSDNNLTTIFDIDSDSSDGTLNSAEYTVPKPKLKKETKYNKSEKPLKHLLPTFDSLNSGNASKLFKLDNCFVSTSECTSVKEENNTEKPRQIKLNDPMCHYNTSLKNLSEIQGIQMRIKLMGSFREELILSPYSSLYLKPYIRRDAKARPLWLQLMAELLLKANKNVDNYVLPSRGPIDYVYIQPSHIPAVNSLCNQFFWPGIDLTECLQYPDFSCVALYRNLVVGFGFLVPDVDVHENYLSFILVRPAWRNCGICKFMIYHLIQTSVGKDITLHVSVNNPAMLLYQKFGFKVEHVVQNFYDKYLRRDAKESKHAFFCRLER